MPKSVRWYIASIALSAAAVTASILGDRSAKREISTQNWVRAVDISELGKDDGSVRGE